MSSAYTFNRRVLLRRGLAVGTVVGIGAAIQPGLLNSAAAQEAPDDAGSNPFVIADGPLNLREDYGLDGAIVGTYPTGATGVLHSTGRVKEADGYNWGPVEMDADGATGYMAVEFLYFTDGSEGRTFTVVDGPLNVRGDVGLDSEVIDQLPTGASGTGYPDTITSADGYDWVQIDLLDGSGGTGYVALDFISFD